MRHTLHTALFLVFLFADLAQAQENWHSRSSMVLKKKGMAETLLLPGLHSQISPGMMDLSLIGPDGRPRAFELYMRDKNVTKKAELVPTQVHLTDDGFFVWEAKAPDMVIHGLSVVISDSQYMGKVQVEGFKNTLWTTLADGEALYSTAGVSRTDISLVPGRYEALRLTFQGTDSKNDKQVLPIESVTATEITQGKPVTKMSVPLTFNRVEKDGFIEVKTRLSGSGMYISNLALSSEAPFIGNWELGMETIRDGRLIFKAVSEGAKTYVNPGPPVLSIDVNQRWPGNSMIIRLFPQGKFIGRITAFDLGLHVPRVLFSADMPGTYSLATGLDKPQTIQDYPQGDFTGDVDLIPLSEVETNPGKQIKQLVEKYTLKGGPFKAKGYSYSSAFHIRAPGYYRLRLNMKSDLDNNRNGLRIVENGVQIPFLFSSEKEESIPLKPVRTYDEGTNRTTWEVTVPEASKHWKHLILTASGMFKRDVSFLLKKPGNTGWKPWQTLSWINTQPGKTTLSIALYSQQSEKKTFRIQMDHQDNQPLELDAMEATYSSVDLLFLARVAGDYHLYGGNRDASPPSYDLSLIQNQLLESLPEDLDVPEPVALDSSRLKEALTGLFQDKSWGLYIILGFVTLILMAVVVKLFPKAH